MTDGYTVACLVPRPTDWQQRARGRRACCDRRHRNGTRYLDAFGNFVNQFGLHEPHDEMAVEANSVVEVTQRPEPVDATTWEHVADLAGDGGG